MILKELVDLKLSRLRLCVTSRLEPDIEDVLEPFNPYKVLLDTQPGHIEALPQFVKSIVNSDQTMRKRSDKTKYLVIDTLSGQSDGMYVMTVVMLRIVFLCDGFQVSVGQLSAGYAAHLLRGRVDHAEGLWVARNAGSPVSACLGTCLDGSHRWVRRPV